MIVFQKTSSLLRTGTARKRWHSKVEDLGAYESNSKEASSCTEANSRYLSKVASFHSRRINESDDDATRDSEDRIDDVCDSTVSPLLESPSDLSLSSHQTWQDIHSNSFSLNRTIYSGSSQRQWVKSPYSPRDSLESNKLDLYETDTLDSSYDMNKEKVPSKFNEWTSDLPKNHDLSMRLKKSSYKAMQRNYSRGALRIKKSIDRPSVLPRGDGSPTRARSD